GDESVTPGKDLTLLPEDCERLKDEDFQPEEISSRTKVFWLIAAGNATGQSFLFNFFSAFAALVGVKSSLMGFITSIRNLVGSLFQGTLGRLSDKYGRKYLLLMGFFLSFSTMAVLIFVYNPVMLIIISMIQAFSLSIIVPVWNASLGDVTRHEDRASYIGKISAAGTAISVSLMLSLAIFFYVLDEKFNSMITIGGVGYLLEEKVQYGIAFGFAAFNFLLCFVGALILKETGKVERDLKQPRMWKALENKSFKKYFIINSVFGLIMALLWPIFPIAQITVLGLDFTQVAITNAVFSISSAITQYFGGKVSDRIGRKPLIIASRMGMFMIPLFMIVALITDQWLYLIPSNIIGGSCLGLLIISQTAYVLDLAPNDQMGAYSGMSQVGWGIATFIGSLSAGFIGDAIVRKYMSLRVPEVDATRLMVIIMFIAICVLRIFAAIGFFFIDESLPKEIRDQRKKNGNGKKPEKEIPVTVACEDSSSQTK
ncbi:MAG: MFS transporter, partial [Candidatus Heimdallarchaeota archaeon]